MDLRPEVNEECLFGAAYAWGVAPGWYKFSVLVA